MEWGAVRKRSFVQQLERVGRFLEDALTVGLLGFMIILASIQIVLRNTFDLGFFWGDEALRVLVLWVAMAGAVAASRADRHITIDVLSRFLPARVKHVVKTLTDVFTASICALRHGIHGDLSPWRWSLNQRFLADCLHGRSKPCCPSVSPSSPCAICFTR